VVAVPEAHAFYVDLFAQHGVTDWKIRWNRKAGEAGSASYRNKTVTFSALAVERWEWDRVIDLGKHELGHVLVGPDHGHDKVWKKKVKELGVAEPAEFCPTFSSSTERALSDLLTPEGVYYVGLAVGGCWVAAPGLAPLATAGALGWYIWQVVRNSRVLPARERRKIEHQTLNP
jgi:hypothetical protein